MITAALRHKWVAVTLLIAAFAGAFAGARLLRADSTGKRAATGVEYPGLPTVAHPLPAFAHTTTLSGAPTALGGSITLPSTSLVQPSDAGPVWVATTPQASTTVAVTFPSQGLAVDYTRPVAYSDPATAYAKIAQEVGSADQVIMLGNTPALATAQNSDMTGANLGEIIFVVNGTEVRVMGHYDESTLQAVAQSILAQATSTS